MFDCENKISITKAFLLSSFSPICHWILRDGKENEAVHVQTLLPEMERRACYNRNRNRIPNKHRERIVRAFQDPHEDYLLVADMLRVNHSTARGIVPVKDTSQTSLLLTPLLIILI